MTPIDAYAFCMELVLDSIEKIEMNYVQALARGDDAPVVLLFDARDPGARAILDEHDQSERVAAMVAESACREMIPIFISGLPRREALRIAGDYFPELESAFETLHPGAGYLLVVIAAGSAAVKVMPPLPE